MVYRRIVHSLVWWLLSYPACFPAEKLSPDQQAPLFARGSGGLILKPPFESARSVATSPAVSTNTVSEDGVEREEIASFKLVDGELVRVVEGHFSYRSPEGIPVSVNYVADENGNRAGFRLGAAATGGTTSHINVGDSRPGAPGGGTTYLPPKLTSSNVDRSYLPPH
ncbi:endocuticle structural glycoprotein SgAbd-1 [Harpegnathos saltator]|uniref:endocuticle structural glycoprotein SgAbd-1 n=1 Tax=Harpegnathos saltator TaxID=610380 RepID=UPI000948F7D5|nr:endocuticle structural glycoprotein SgAbd-1 [Harpegnathos saltator]